MLRCARRGMKVCGNSAPKWVVFFWIIDHVQNSLIQTLYKLALFSGPMYVDAPPW